MITLTDPGQFSASGLLATEPPADPLSAPRFSTLDLLATEPPLDAGLPERFHNPMELEMNRPWDEAHKARVEAMRKKRDQALERVDAALLDPEGYFKKNPFNPAFTTDPDKARKRLLVHRYLRWENGGRPIPMGSDGIDLMRAKIAGQRFGGKGADSDEVFLGEITREAGKRKDRKEVDAELIKAARAAAAVSFADPTAVQGEWTAARLKVAGMKGYQTGKDAEFLERFNDARDFYREKMDSYSDELASVFGAFKAKQGVRQAAMTAYRSMSGEERQGFMEALKLASEALPEKERFDFWASMRQQFGRDVSGAAQSLSDYAATNTAMFESARQSRNDPLGLQTPEQLRTVERYREQDAAAREEIDFTADVQRIEQSVFDPIDYISEKGSWARTFEEIGYAAPGALATTAAAAIPGLGMPMFYATAREGAYQEFRSRFEAAGDDYATASRKANVLAPFAGVGEMVMERLQIAGILGKLPVLENAMKAATSRMSSRLGQLALRTGTGAMVEGSAEQLQGYLPDLVQEAAGALKMEVPGVQWTGEGGVLDGFWKDNVKNVGIMLPLAILMGGRGVVADSRRVSQIEAAGDLQLKALGATPEALAAFRKADTFQSKVEALDAMAASLAPQSEAAKDAVAEMEAQAEEQTAALAEAKASGLMPDIVQRKEADGSFSYEVLDGETRESVGTAPDMSGAMRLAMAHSAAFDEKRAERVAYLASALEAGEQALAADGNATGENRFELGTLMTEAMAAAESPDAIDQFHSQAALKEKIDGGSGEVTRVALGRHRSEVRAGVRHATNRLFKGASVLTVFHEMWHGMWRKSRAAGTITRDEALSFVRGVQQAVGEGKLKRGRTAGESLAFLPADFDALNEKDQDTALDEALSEIAEMEILRTRKRAKDKKPIAVSGGIVARNLNALMRLAPGATKKFRALIEAARGVMGLSSARALAMKKAIREGRINESEYEAFLDKMAGRDLQAEHDGIVRDEHAAILGQEAFEATEDAPFSMAPSSPEREARPIAPLVISSEALPGAKRDWHKAIREYIGKHLIGRTLTNKDSGRSITFTGTSKREAPSKLRKETAFRAAKEIESITEESVFLGDVPSKGGREAAYDTVSYFAMPVMIDGREAVAWFNALDPKSDQASVFYEFGLAEQKNRPGLPEESLSDSAESSASSKPGPAKTVGEFLNEIKDSLPAAIKVAEESSPFSLAGGNAAGFLKAQAEGRTFIGKDGKERFEMNASEARFGGLMDRFYEGAAWQLPLDTVIEFDELFENYPQMRGISVKAEFTRPNHGSFNPKTNTITLSLNDFPEKQASILLHEIQHWIQEFEGFASGGNVGEQAMQFRDEVRRMGLPDPDVDQMSNVGFRRYRELPGEKEARGVQVRASMTAEERAARPFMQDWDSYSLAPAAFVESLSVNASARIKDPRVKAAIFTRMLDRLGQLKRDRDELGIAFGKGYKRRAIDDPRKEASIRKEAAMREALRRVELEDEAHARHHGILHGDDLSKLWNQPTWAAIAKPDDPLHGRILSYSAWRRRNPGENMGGEYDGSTDVPRVAFGGNNAPDQIAQELYDNGQLPHPTPDALWDALKREAASIGKFREMMAAAREDLRKARLQAKEEATAWMNDRLNEEAANYSPRQRLLRALAMLDAILSVLPPEVRGRIGGYTQLAKLAGDEARLKFLNERVAKAEVELDKWIKDDHRKQLADLLEKAKPKKNKPGEAKRGKIGVEAHRIFAWATKYATLDETQVDAERIAIENERERIADESVPGIVHPDLLELSNRERALDLVGDFENKSPADQAAALSWLRGTYTFGRDEWQAKESERLAEIARLQRVVIEELAKQKGVTLPSLEIPKFDNRTINGMTAEEAEPILRDHDTRVRNVLAKHKAALRKALEEGGVGSLAARQEREREEQGKEARTMLEAGTGEFISFVQTLERLLGPGHPLVARWNAAVGEAQMQKTEAMLEADAAWLKAASEALGNPGKLKVQERLWAMSAEQTVTIEKQIREPGSELEVRISNVPGLLDGTLDPADHGMTADDLPALQEAWDAHQARTDKGKERTEFLTFKTVGERTTQQVKLTAMQAITLVLTGRMARYAKNLELHGFTPEVVASAAAQVGPEGMAMADWLADYYDKNYEPLAVVFREMFGVDLPKEANYSPFRAERGGVDKDIGGPQEAGMVPEGGFRANMLKTRAPSHQLAPALLGAVSVFQGHVAVSEHWRAFAPLVREMKAVLGGLETRHAIEAVHGKALVRALDGWLLAFEQNGLKQRKLSDGVDRLIRGMQGNIAILGLAFRVSTIVKNYILPAFGSARRIGILPWLRGLARVASGKVSYRKFRENRVVTIRERAGFSPEMKLAAAKLLSDRPSHRRNAVIWAMEQIAIADARSTALSAAISWDYHYRENAANGLSAEDAATLADAQMTDDVRRTAQPMELAERSLYELSSSEAGRLLFLFATDARKETAIFAEAMRRAWKENGAKGLLTNQEFRTAATAIWLTTGLLNTVISRALMDSMDGGDDDEWFDEKNWSPTAVLSSTLLGPVGGIPLLRDLVSGFSQGEMTKPLRGLQAAGNLIEAAWEGDIPDKDRALWVERQINKIMVGAGLFHRGAAEMGAFSNIIDQAARMLDNATSD